MAQDMAVQCALTIIQGLRVGNPCFQISNLLALALDVLVQLSDGLVDHIQLVTDKVRQIVIIRLGV